MHFTPDGTRLVTASGVAGLGGVAAIWNVADGALVRQFEGHRDILYDAELSPDGKRLATCGYDKKIELWDADSGKPLRTLEGHTGAVYDVAFSPDSRFLVSASADDTCKVWRVEDGQRMDTLPQPLKAEYTCTFSPDGRTIVAAGADNNIRVWQFVSRDKPEINPMVIARFAHEGADRAAGVHARRHEARFAGRGPHHQGLANQRLQRAAALGEPARRGDGAGVRRRRRVVRGRADGRLAGVLRDPGRRAGRTHAVLAQAQAGRRSPANGKSINESPSTSRTTSPGQANRLTLPARDHRHDRRRHRRPVRCRLLPLHGQGRRAVGVRGERGPFQVEAGFVPRGARRPGPPGPAGAPAGGARLVLHVPRQERQRDRRLSRLQLGGDATSTITCIPTARS